MTDHAQEARQWATDAREAANIGDDVGYANYAVAMGHLNALLAVEARLGQIADALGPKPTVDVVDDPVCGGVNGCSWSAGHSGRHSWEPAPRKVSYL
jgi:hypothetical protein